MINQAVKPLINTSKVLSLKIRFDADCKALGFKKFVIHFGDFFWTDPNNGHAFMPDFQSKLVGLILGHARYVLAQATFYMFERVVIITE